MDNINVNDEVNAPYEGETQVGRVTHIRDVDDSGPTYRLLRSSDDWFMGWFTADQLSAVEYEDEDEDATVDTFESEDDGPKDGGVNDA